jgi:hypothetical protein
LHVTNNELPLLVRQCCGYDSSSSLITASLGNSILEKIPRTSHQACNAATAEVDNLPEKIALLRFDRLTNLRGFSRVRIFKLSEWIINPGVVDGSRCGAATNCRLQFEGNRLATVN